jgi:hypothetical protein
MDGGPRSWLTSGWSSHSESEADRSLAAVCFRDAFSFETIMRIGG